MFYRIATGFLAAALGLAGCMSSKGLIEYSGDSRNFNRLSLSGGGELTGDIETFSVVDIDSSRRSSGRDLDNFYGEIKATREVSHGFGAAVEYNDGSGHRNSRGRLGLSWKPPIKGVGTVRIYPVTTDNVGQQVVIPFGREFGSGERRPYISGFTDINREKDGDIFVNGEIQVGVKSDGWKVFVEPRYFDSDRKNGLENPGLGFGIGLDF